MIAPLRERVVALRQAVWTALSHVGGTKPAIELIREIEAVHDSVTSLRLTVTIATGRTKEHVLGTIATSSFIGPVRTIPHIVTALQREEVASRCGHISVVVCTTSHFRHSGTDVVAKLLVRPITTLVPSIATPLARYTLAALTMELTWLASRAFRCPNRVGQVEAPLVSRRTFGNVKFDRHVVGRGNKWLENQLVVSTAAAATVVAFILCFSIYYFNPS